MSSTFLSGLISRPLMSASTVLLAVLAIQTLIKRGSEWSEGRRVALSTLPGPGLRIGEPKRRTQQPENDHARQELHVQDQSAKRE